MVRLFKELLEAIFRPIPGVIGRKIRFYYYKNQFAACGSQVIIEEGVHLVNPQEMYLGSHIWIDKNTMLIAGAFKPNGRNYITKGEMLIAPGTLHLEDNVHIAPFTLMQAHGGVRIGQDVTVASGAKIYSLSHHYRNLNEPSDKSHYSFSTMAPSDKQFLILGNVIVGNYAAVGLNAVVLPGVYVPEGTWLAAGATVNSSTKLKAYSVYPNCNHES